MIAALRLSEVKAETDSRQEHTEEPGHKNVIQKYEHCYPYHIAFFANQADHGTCGDDVMNANHVAGRSTDGLQGNHPDRVGTNILCDAELKQ